GLAGAAVRGVRDSNFKRIRDLRLEYRADCIVRICFHPTLLDGRSGRGIRLAAAAETGEKEKRCAPGAGKALEEHDPTSGAGADLQPGPAARPAGSEGPDALNTPASPVPRESGEVVRPVDRL